ncbi:MAG: NAD(P)/FAD-dependent oxidoreductase [Clostridia bacterium]|nr:NAD(P)/FAD-dependent oxidoreductase [Clostridia bacterium]
MNACKTRSVAVIGAGPAGMMAAIAAAERGVDVVIYEQNRYVGKKLGITGKGRCNVTNECEPDEFLRHVPTNPKFLYSAIYSFTPRDAMDFFEKRGVALKTERGRRVFPVSDKAADIVNAFKEELSSLGIRIIRERVKDIVVKDGEASGVIARDMREYAAVIVATGGLSYPLTGSTGDGYAFAENHGIEVTPRKASLVPIVTKEDFSEMSGLTLKNVVLTVKDNGRVVFSEMGEMLFTHFGVSGPLVLSASAHMTKKDPGAYTMSVDLKPALSNEELDARVLSDFAKYSNRDFLNALGDLLPHNLIPYIVEVSGIPPRIKINSVTKEMRASLVSTLKSLTITPVATRPVDEAIVTCGGVSVKEIVPSTMESKKIKRLYFAGEVVDVDAYTGGYNLQIAYATGRLAGQSAAETYCENN